MRSKETNYNNRRNPTSDQALGKSPRSLLPKTVKLAPHQKVRID